MKRERLTFEEHVEASRLLDALKRAESALFHHVAGRVPKAVAGHLLRFDRNICAVQSALEDVMFKQLSGDPRLSTDIYYPAQEREGSA